MSEVSEEEVMDGVTDSRIDGVTDSAVADADGSDDAIELLDNGWALYCNLHYVCIIDTTAQIVKV